MSKFNLAQENPNDMMKISDEFLEINQLLVRIAVLQFLIDWDDTCIKCKCEWFEFGDYLVEKFKLRSFQIQNK